MVLTSVQITEEDYKFCKSNQLKFSELLRESINHHKDIISGIITDNIEAERRKRENFQKIAYELRQELEVLKDKIKNGI